MLPESDIKELSVERNLDSETGELSVEYSWRGRRVPQIALSGAAAQRLSGLALIQKDLGNALAWVHRAEELFSHTTAGHELEYVQIEDRKIGNEIKSLFVSALVFYAKAFTKAAGRRAQMSRKWLDPAYHERHDFFMSYRHNMAAHSGNEALELAQSYVLIVPGKHGPDIRLATTRMQPDLATSEVSDETFGELIEHAIEKVVEKYNDSGRAIAACVMEQGPHFWLDAARGEAPVDLDGLLKR